MDRPSVKLYLYSVTVGKLLWCMLLLAACDGRGDEIEPVDTTLKSTQPGAFVGSGGVYALGSGDVPTPESLYQNTRISGVAVRTRWENLETSPGAFNWAFLDGEIAKAQRNNKKVSIAVMGQPSWLKSIGVPFYEHIDQNSYHSTYLDTLTGFITWDQRYVIRLKILIDRLAAKYRNESAVAYFNLVSGQMSRNLPAEVVGGIFYTQYNYNADTLVMKMKDVLDHYMTRFPNTPLWSSIDYVTFEPQASGKPRNYAAAQYADYGVSTYPDRFGLFREDISGCNPNLSNIPSGSQWFVMQQYTCRTGAQMLWSVQDGPDRMNKCGISPNTKPVVLEAAVQQGLALGMRYLEIYSSDITDASLSAVCESANEDLLLMQSSCTNQ